jgi:hypothetical protein
LRLQKQNSCHGKGMQKENENIHQLQQVSSDFWIEME